MLADPKKHPSFCAFLFEEGFKDKLLMPRDFIKDHEMMLGKGKICILKTDEEMSWTAKLVEADSNLFICEGEWPEFVAYHKLELGDILLFYLVDISTFLVLPYNKKCCENIHGLEEQGEKNDSKQAELSKEEIYESMVNIMKDVNFDTTTPSDVIRQLGSHFGVDLVHRKEELKSIMKVVFRNMILQPSDAEKARHAVESEKQNAENGSSSDSWEESCRMQKLQSKIVHDKNTTVGKERSIAYQRAKAFKSENPFIVLFMHPSYLCSKCSLSIPLKFAKKYFLENCKDLVLRVPGRGPCSVKCTLGSFNAKIQCGWKQFSVDNGLKVGDVCIFEVIKGTQLFIDVTIYRAAGSIPIRNNSKFKEEHLAISQGSKRKRPEAEAEDDVSVDSPNKSVVEEEEFENRNEEKFPKETTFTVMNLINKDPYYVIVVKRSHLRNMTGIIDMKRMILVNEKGKEWRVGIKHSHRCVQTTSGWPVVRRDNNISYGETWLFKLIRRQDGSDVLLIQKIQNSHSTPTY